MYCTGTVYIVEVKFPYIMQRIYSTVDDLLNSLTYSAEYLQCRKVPTFDPLRWRCYAYIIPIEINK
jgi:hypothetical protein